MVIDLGDGGEWKTSSQAPCDDCVEWGPCLGPADLPEDWRVREPWASQACATDRCTCWGGADHECEDCWLYGK